MQEFVDSLVSKNIFAKEVPCSNIAYHSRYIADAGPGLLKYLSEVIKTPKARSVRWVSTSVPMDKWDEPSAKYSSAEYHTNNLLNPVLFEETSNLIPADAILVEVAPHGLLQSILRRSLPQTCTNVPLTRRGCPDNAIFLLEAIGNLYNQGLNPKVDVLYPKIEFPVSTGTPMMSHLVEWAHHEKWPVPLYSKASKKTASAVTNIISLHDEEHSYLKGHIIGERIVYPFSAVLVAVWDALAMTLAVAKRKLPVQFRDVICNVQPILHDRRQLRLSITLQRSGRFEVLDDMDSIVISGFINEFNEKHSVEISSDKIQSESPIVTSKEIYEHFLSRGLSYKDGFKGIYTINESFNEAEIKWSGDWVTFIDGIIQLNNLRHSHDACSQLNFIRTVTINPEEQNKYDSGNITAVVLKSGNLTNCGGVVMENVNFNDLPKPTENSTKLRRLKFIPYFTSDQFDFETIIQVYLQIVAENVGTKIISILGIYNNKNTLSQFDDIKRIMEDVPEIKTMFTWLNGESIMKEEKSKLSNVQIVLINGLATDEYICKILHEAIENNTFIVNLRDSANNMTNIVRQSALYQVVCDHSITSSLALELARWQPTNRIPVTSAISVNTSSDLSLMVHEIDSLLPHQSLLVLTTYPAVPLLKPLLDQFKSKPDCNIHLVMNSDKVFDDDALIDVDLAVKIIKDGVIGGEYYVPLHSKCSVKGNVTLQSSGVGQIESLEWIQAPAQHQQSIGVSVEVHYAAINDLDAKRLTGTIPFGTFCRGYGMDFSGITESVCGLVSNNRVFLSCDTRARRATGGWATRSDHVYRRTDEKLNKLVSCGERVMGLVKYGAVSSLIQAHPDCLWPVPSYWSLEEAATIPLAYCLAYYCLTVKSTLCPGMRVLVHGGAGALGQAVISLALSNRCEVFVTVANIRKKQFLLKMYPGLKAENIGNSRDVSFSDLVLTATNGKGVDIIISTLNAELKLMSLKCVAHSGVIIDVSQFPSREHFDYGMFNMTKARSYVTVDFISIFNEKSMIKKLQQMVSDGIAKGWVRPLSYVMYTPRDVSRAFRLMAGSNHLGKVLLHLQRSYIDAICARSRLECSSKKLHVIISDHGDFGLQLADMIISRGVRKIYLRLPVSQDNYKLRSRHWQKLGVDLTWDWSNTLGVPELLADDWSTVPDHIEGIYIIITANHTSVLKTGSFVEKIDAITRKVFPDLRYFAVINTVNSVGEETCKVRNKDNFTGTMLRLSELKEIGSNDKQESISIGEAVDAVEQAIVSNASILSAHVVPTPSGPLLHQIATAAGLTITPDITESTTLSDVGMDSSKENIVLAYLRNMYNIFFNVHKIRGLTVERIKYLDETLTRLNFGNDKGLNELFTYVDTDETLATTDMVFLTTLTNSASWRDVEFDVKSSYLCIVPGVEGNYGRFRSLCEQLKISAMLLQPDIARPHETIPEMARRFAEILSKTANPDKQMYLLGYESGVFTVLEMAAILEENGFKTLVFCIGNPNHITTEIEEHLKGLDTKEALQDAILRHMFGLLTKCSTDELESALRGAFSWQEKLDVTVRVTQGKVSHSLQYTRQLIVAAYGRMLSMLEYKMQIRTLRSQLIILQTKSTNTMLTSNLQQYSEQSVVIYELLAPLSRALDDLRCAAIINGHLGADVLQEFEGKNRLDTYFLHTNDIMTWTTEVE